MSSLATDHSAEILARAIQPGNGDLSAEAARSILGFQLAEDDRRRVDELAARARSGELLPEERTELDDYERTAALLEILQSKARHSLKETGLLS